MVIDPSYGSLMVESEYQVFYFGIKILFYVFGFYETKMKFGAGSFFF